MLNKSNQSDNSGNRPDKPGDNAAEQSNRTGNSLLQSLPIAIVSFDSELRIVEANAGAKEILHPDDYIDQSLARGAGQAALPGWTPPLKHVLTSREARTFDNVPYALKGDTRLLRITCAPLLTSDAPSNAAGIMLIEDVTETANLHKQLAEAERLAALGRLAAKVAHELNNPMDGILRYVNLAIRAVENQKLEKTQEYLAQSREGLMRMLKITSELLEFSRRSRTSFECVRIEQIVEDAIKAMEPRAEAQKVRITREYERHMPEIRSGNLFQVFSNLTKNALDAMPDGGELIVSTRLEGPDTIVIEFQDSGPGFAQEDAEAIFKPFFTGSESGKGTGLGLAICRDILENRKGCITAENAPEGGAIFKVFLPLEGNAKEKP